MMNIQIKSLFVACLLSLSSVSALAALEPVSGVEVKQVMGGRGSGGLTVQSTTLTFKAWSGGCTVAEDFAVSVEQTETEQQITIHRTNEDACEAVARLTKIELPVEKVLATKPIRVMNPVAVQMQFPE